MNSSYMTPNLITTYEKNMQNIVKRNENDNVERLKEKHSRKRISSLIILKFFIFALFKWIIERSNESNLNGAIKDSSMQGVTTICARTNRRLAEPKMDFDEVYETFKKNVLEKLGCNEEECKTIRSSVKSYFDEIKWKSTNQQDSNLCAGENGELNNLSEEKCEETSKEKNNLKSEGILNSFINFVINYKLTCVTFLIFTLMYFKSKYLFFVMGIIIMLNLFWELESLNKKLKFA
ncbi:Plasmodium exported protein, unknown function [Plasmodium gonderi]|uniref:Uncharacterized protein n=1 Tax=Plasmodium gonderi TaxID=77519 RepID=A0A1Y1JI23_PLAGO|nr:Plasmodium exported protein, unknown function [Plasmodium gonderi]GAW80442.1 Plasmodium exported protein, unknown function [Plasmodium gonderi]